MSDVDIANFADIADFAILAKRSASVPPLQTCRHQCARNLNWCRLILKALILLASVDAGM